MEKTLFTRRFAMPLCAVALMCSGQPSFAQSSPESADLIGKWELFSVDSDETTIPREKMEITAKTLEILDNCNEQSYTYTIKDGELTATPPLGITLMACSDKTQERNQEILVTTITHSMIQLRGGALQLTPLPRPFRADLKLIRKIEFRREN